MDCHDAKERLRRERSGTAIRRHLARCPDCREFSRDLADGARELSAVFLSVPPSAGFEERVAQQVAEREISIRRHPRALVAAAVVPVVLLLLALGAAWLHPPNTGEPSPPAAPAPEPVVTWPGRENPLELFVWRERSDSDTEILLRFAGESVAVEFSGDVETTLLEHWGRGARRVEMRVSPEVPGREIVELIGLLEKSGFSWQIDRKK